MADVPSPHRPVDLIMQGAQGLGAGIGQWAQDTAPGDPILDKYINRLLAGEDPNQLANEARNDQVFQMMLAELRKGQRAPIDPAQRTPDVGYAKGQQYPTVQQPGAMNPVAGGLANVQQGGGAWNPNRPLLSGDTNRGPNHSGGAWIPPQPAPQQGLGAMTEQPAAKPPATQPPNVMQGDAGSMLNMTNQAVAELGGTPNPLPREPIAQPPFTGPNAALSMPQPRPQPAQAPAQRPQQQAQVPAEAQPKPRTAREQQRIMQFLPAVAAAQGRENVATIKAQSSERVAQMRNDVAAALGMLKERGLDTGRMEKMLTIATKLPLDAQIAVMREMGLQMRSEWENETKRRGIASKGPKIDPRLKLVSDRIKNLETARSNVAGSALRGPGGKVSKDAKEQITRIDSEIANLKQFEADLSKLYEPEYKAPAQLADEGTESKTDALGRPVPGRPAQWPTAPNGKEYNSTNTDSAKGTIEYLMDGEVVDTFDLRNPASQIP